ncbi:MAG: HesA/MoeB/ThiF family protein [Gammaproteobacteria bacterium]|nr:HesA/MoeB/ThiF family protein [Gammaproteobacteria bacterium]
MLTDKQESLNSDEYIRYSRQIMIEQWGESTQISLKKLSVIIVGAGGLGNIAASYLVGAGVGYVAIVDGDEVELSNLPRQIAFDIDSIENSKAYELAERLRSQNDHVEVVGFHGYITADNIQHLIPPCDLVIDCTDNFEIRQLLNRHCVVNRIPLLSGSVTKWQGQLLLVDPRQPAAGCYRCLFSQDQASEGNCNTIGVIGPMVGVIGAFQASQALAYLTRQHCQLSDQIALIDGDTLGIKLLQRSKNAQCSVCHTVAGE